MSGISLNFVRRRRSGFHSARLSPQQRHHAVHRHAVKPKGGRDDADFTGFNKYVLAFDHWKILDPVCGMTSYSAPSVKCGRCMRNWRSGHWLVPAGRGPGVAVSGSPA
jgi:hypothetical protein